MSENIYKTLLKYGSDIMKTPEFKAAGNQTHHACTTVAEHSISVALVSIALCGVICKLVKANINMDNVVTAALCHDLGILGRSDKYKNNFECLRKHPTDSVNVYRKMFGEGNERVEDAIKRHMWPLLPTLPHHREGYILTLSDKISSCMERLGHSPARSLYIKSNE